MEIGNYFFTNFIIDNDVYKITLNDHICLVNIYINGKFYNTNTALIDLVDYVRCLKKNFKSDDAIIYSVVEYLKFRIT